MSLQYSCHVSNRYTGYLDSSDYGHSANLDGKSVNKRKGKKKRKPKYRKYVNKAVNTDDLVETAENSHEESDAQFVSDAAETADKIDKEKTFKTNDSSNAATALDAMTQTNTSIDSGKCTTESTVDGQSLASDSKSIKWSDICFEEEKSMNEMEMKMETQAIYPLETDEQFENPAPALEERKVYPTMFFYNSNYRGFHRIDGHSLPNRRRHSSFHQMDTADDARMKRRPGSRIPSKRSQKIDTN